tara:strand:+ start:500 stop:697 length:198 start_codon:yes stop_codon:yes gene_type:complete
MNMAIEKVIRDINRIKEKETNKENKGTDKEIKVRSLKEKTTETIKAMNRNNSTDNFMKFQWSWTL